MDYQLTAILEMSVHPYYERVIKQKKSSDAVFLPVSTKSFIEWLTLKRTCRCRPSLTSSPT